ncbi:MAG: protein-glutamate O-methyltransferase CheR [Pedosphaera sp.]|nr:protein-glutamate O-methyltransferase CheR [Pedosphaera sp.]
MSITSQEFDFVRRLISTSSGITLEDGKEYLVDMRLASVARQFEISSVSDLIARMQSPSETRLHRPVVDAMTTNETSFFRDLHPFDAVRTDLLPEMMKLRAAERKLTIWCGASSTGQEPFTLAMLIREHFPELARWKVEIVATDISGAVLAKAREGIFSQLEVNRGLPATYLIKYFQTGAKGWRLKDDILKMVDFRYLNLIEKWPEMPSCDLVFMRNVMIYFKIEIKKAILRKIANVMRSDGYLLLGGSETTLNLDDAYQRVPVGKTICYRLGKAAGSAAPKKV